MTEIFTIGFTKTTAQHFFGRLEEARIERLLDVRLQPKLGFITLGTRA